MDQLAHILPVFLVAFLIGSFPTAYLLVRRHSGKDLRVEGSGNIGTLNAYEVSNSKRVGVIVLLVDLAKGALPIALTHLLLAGSFVDATTAMLAVILGHNYSPWIGWKGGRGLAPAAGAALLFNPLLPAVWVVLWLAGWFKTRDVHFGNIAATVLSPFIVLIVPAPFEAATLFPVPGTLWLVLASAAMFVLIFLKHLGPLRTLLRRGDPVS
jgi:glycerol-3-phosphate acyltransferase PlsY